MNCYLWAELLVMFETEERVIEWLKSPNPMLGDETPIHMLTHFRIGEVEQVIDVLMSGAHA